jgi:OmpA-OmpF porin, OOP family
MLKTKLLLSTLLALSAIAVSTAYADVNTGGFYIGGEAGWDKIHASPLDGSTFASNSAGLLNVGNGSQTSSLTDSGISGRAYLGYQINQYIGAELGFTQFHNISSSVNGTVTTFGPLTPPGSSTVNGSSSITTNAVDLVAKATLPLPNNFNLYGKAGAAYVNQYTSYSGTTTISGTTYGAANGTITEHALRPTFGLGVSYNITPNWVADVSWNRIQQVGSSTSQNDIPSSDLFGAGLTYFFN